MSNYKFKGVYIPASVWLDDRLSPTQKMLLCEIDAMSDGEKDPCYAGNEHFSNHLKCSVGSVRNMIVKLKKLGYILTKYKDTRTHFGRSIWTNLTPSSENDTPSSENDTPSSENDTPSSENDTYINTPLNQLLNTPLNLEEEEEEINLDFIDDYINFITEGMQGVRRPTAYRKSIINKIQNRDKQTLKNYLDFCSDLLLLEETKNIDMAIFEDFKLNLDGVVYKCNFAGRSETNRVIVNYEGVTGSQQMTIHESQFFKSLMTA